MNLNTTSLAKSIFRQYEKRLLIRALPRLVHGRWSQKATINGYGSYEVRRYSGLAPTLTPLTEATTPAQEAAPTITDIVMTPVWYGSWIGFSKEVETVAFDPFISEVTGALGEQAGLSADTLIRNALTQGATKDFSGNVSARTALDFPAHEITYADLIKQLAELEASNALPIDGDDFIVIIHPLAVQVYLN